MAAENFKVKKGLEVGTGITANSDGINVTGIITAVQYKGDGSGLTNVVGSGSGVVVKDEGSPVGTAGTINFVGAGVVATLSAGIATVTINAGTTTITNNADNRLITGSGTANTLEAESGLTYDGTYLNHIGSGFKQLKIDTSTSNSASLLLKNQQGSFTVNTINNAGNKNFTIYDGNAGATRLSIDGGGTVGITSGLNVTGVSTFASAIDANGDLDVDGQTNLDDVRITGVTTMTGTLQGATASFGAVSGTTGTFSGNITGPLLSISPGSGDDGIILLNSAGGQNNDFSRIRQVISDNSFRIENKDSGSYESILSGIGSGAVKLYFAGNEKLTTTGTGIEVPDLSVTGVGTIGRVDVNGLVFGTNATTFAAKFPDDAVANFGTHNDLKISHDDTHARITNTKGDIVVSGIISATSDIKVGSAITMDPTSGIITATKFSGDGSLLTGITASGTGIIVKHDGSTVGTAGTINFSTNLDVTPIHAGIVTVTASGSGGGITINNNGTSKVITGSGTANTLNANVNLTFDGTTLDVKTGTGVVNTGSVVVGSGVTINSTGINATGIAITAYNLIANHRLTVGSGIYGTEKILLNGGDGGDTNHYAGGTSYSQHIFRLLQGGSSITRFRISVQGAVVSGICTATTFSGAGTSLTSLPAEELTGTIAGGRFPTTLPAVSGANLTNLTGASSGTYGSSSLVPMITVDSNGRITGIATTSVSSGGGATDKIEEGNSSVEVIDTGTGKIDVIADGSYVSRFQKVTGNRTYMLVGNPQAVSNDYGTNNGHLIVVGNSSSEPATLRLFGWGSGSSDGTINNRIDFASHQSGSGGQTFAKIETVIRGSSDNSSDLTFHTASSATVSEKVRIRATGNIGIGITNPTSKLHVNGDAKVVGVMTATSFVGNLSDAVTSRWTVGNNGASDYSFTGPGGLSSTNDPKLYLARGQTYEFVITNGNTHPFQIQQSNGTPYNTGVTNNGVNTNGVVVKFEVPFSAPNTLQYRCTAHGSMGNTIIVYPDLSP